LYQIIHCSVIMAFTRQCRRYNNDKYYRPFYFSSDISRFRKFPVRAPRANPFLIPAATALNSWRCEFQERGEGLPFYLHEILLRQESTRRSRVCRRKDIPRAPLVRLIERVPSQPYFHPSSHEVVNSRSPGRTSVNIDVNLEERGNLWKRKRRREREREWDNARFSCETRSYLQRIC